MEELGIGKLIDKPQHRDAIHVAIFPAVAAKALKPNDDVGLVGQQVDGVELVASDAETLIGKVDPFLTLSGVTKIQKGQKFWVYLYPNTVTSLRHNWTHAAFEGPPVNAEYEFAKKWLTEFAENMGMEYDHILTLGRRCALDGGVTVGGNSEQDRFNEVKVPFLRHIGVIINQAIDPENVYFSCSC